MLHLTIWKCVFVIKSDWISAISRGSIYKRNRNSKWREWWSNIKQVLDNASRFSRPGEMQTALFLGFFALRFISSFLCSVLLRDWSIEVVDCPITTLSGNCKVALLCLWKCLWLCLFFSGCGFYWENPPPLFPLLLSDPKPLGSVISSPSFVLLI